MRIAFGIEYDGTGMLGWQTQRHGPSVQQAVESALSFVADAPVEAVCAGRTDAGVHARCQVAHADIEAQRTSRAWVLGANARLPDQIAVRWAVPVADAFHARYSAIARRYRYTIVNRKVRPALDARFATWERLPLDAAAMHEAAQVLLGEHDFSAFRSVACQAKSPVRRMELLSVSRTGEFVHLEVRGNAFLHHMVRNLAGSLMAVGRGERPASWIGELLAGRDRPRAAPTAPAEGLVFIGPVYPGGSGLPEEVV
jgi:tRNA pseudouridine38-40 synthase